MRVNDVHAYSIALFLLSAASLSQDGTSEPSASEPFSYTRVYADTAGVSHFTDEEMPLAPFDLGPGMPSVPASRSIATAGLGFFCFPAGTVVDWHPAPRPQFYVILTGELEMEVGDGEVRRFAPGSVLLGEATKGQGVRAVWSGRERACLAVAPVAEE